MTLERFIGYSGFVLILIHLIPLPENFIIITTVILGLGLILSGTYLRWRVKIRRYVDSQQGHMTIPGFFERLENEGRAHRNQKSQKPPQG